MDLRVVNLRVELPPFYRRLGYAETGIAPFAGDAQPSGPATSLKCQRLSSEVKWIGLEPGPRGWASAPFQ
jgi:hypothetical protein